MKRINVVNGVVDVIELNLSIEASSTHPFVVDDATEVFAGYISNGDGTFTPPAAAAPTNTDVNVERERRVNLVVPVYLSTGKVFAVDMAGGGRANIGDLALMAVIKNGAGVTTDFTFRDANDTNQTLTNDEVIEMGMQAAASYDAYYKKSWALKELSPIPQDYEDDSYWT